MFHTPYIRVRQVITAIEMAASAMAFVAIFGLMLILA